MSDHAYLLIQAIFQAATVLLGIGSDQILSKVLMYKGLNVWVCSVTVQYKYVKVEEVQ